LGLAVGVINGIIYAVGGDASGGGNFLNVVEAYDAATNTWTTKASMPKARGGLAVGVISDILYAVGGCCTRNGSMKTVEAYNPVTNTWFAMASMPSKRDVLAAGVVNRRLYAIGGFNHGASSIDDAFNPR
jgi:N-acetylneuraminic acid mutarotase